MIARPFQVCYLNLRIPNTLEIQMTLENPLPTDAALLAQLRKPIQQFQQVAALGGMAGDLIPPTNSSLELVEHRASGAHELYWSFQKAHIDVGALVVVENLIHHLHLTKVPIRRLLIASDMISDGAPKEQELPYLYEPLPFNYSIEVEAVEVFIEVEFEHEQEKNVLAKFEEAWRVWLALATSGGFADDTILPEDIKIFPADNPRCLPDRISFSLDDVCISDQAYDSLINIFYRLHFQAAPIASVLIY